MLRKLKHSIVQESHDSLTNELENVLPVEEDVPMIVSVQSKIHNEALWETLTHLYISQYMCTLSVNSLYSQQQKSNTFPHTECI